MRVPERLVPLTCGHGSNEGRFPQLKGERVIWAIISVLAYHLRARDTLLVCMVGALFSDPKCLSDTVISQTS